MNTELNCLFFRYRALYAISGVSPACTPPQLLTLVMLAKKHTRNACLLCNPSNHAARGAAAQDSFVVDNDESIPKRELIWGPQTGRQEPFRIIRPVSSSINWSIPLPRPPSNGHFTP
ncbi:hypothetical protein O181_026187 [Austropuccinia psidii MF-1]|uniref:Uncharacterized protein n=1 Tax=Austropuccinia psidii MF-1 TaxID=1389203 RepID=A0A9Q3CML6_9BASI|nr:hypothetical protein [Austropuccinia psidii MF-1]